MQPTAICPELKKIRIFIDPYSPIPEHFLAHARTCEICLFWLSYSLALLESYRTTNRIIVSQHICPKKEAFHDLLWQGIRTQQVHPLISEEVTKSSQGATLDESEEPESIWEHLNRCDFCCDYYNSLYATAPTAKERYKALIHSGQPVRPLAEGTGKELLLSTVNYVPIRNPHQKPN